jgi:hypothetical protein
MGFLVAFARSPAGRRCVDQTKSMVKTMEQIDKKQLNVEKPEQILGVCDFSQTS